MIAAFLNERSCLATIKNLRAADLLMDRLASTLAKLLNLDGQAHLVSESPLSQVQLGKNYWFGQWAGSTSLRDQRAFLMTMAARTPYAVAGELDDDTTLVEYSMNGVTVLGLGYAHAFDGIAVSLASSSEWIDKTHVVLVRSKISAELTETTDVVVAHASRPSDLNAHSLLIANERARTIASSADLWSERSVLYPRLRFLPRVRDQLQSLHAQWRSPVRDRLAELDEAVGRWDPAVALPEWSSFVTPEGETRKQLCWFDDGNERHLFDLHARFTPYDGRIHFRLDAYTRQAVVAHIGHKL